MALQYTRVDAVEPGGRIASSQWNQLAQAFNDRFSQGVGDPTYRLHWYLHSIFRAFRLNNGLNFAAEDEWWKFYSHIKPSSGLDYPDAPAGQVEGINPNNPLGTFVFGSDQVGIESEPNRINYSGATGEGVVLQDALGAPVSDLDHWAIGKYQRGVTDSTGDDLDQANALVAARHYLRLKGFGFLHKGYGGFLPSPGINGYCEEEDQDGILDINLKFTKLSDSSESTYSTCQGGTGSGSAPNTSKSVLFWGGNTSEYILYHHDGSITKLLFSEYVEGPYNGANDDAWLNRLDGDQLARAVNFYCNDFRGDASERADPSFHAKDYAFQFERFFTRQYYLAPAYGVPSGYGDGSLDAVYPNFDWPSSTPANTLGTTSGATSHTVHSGFVFAGLIAIGTGLTESKTFRIYVDGVQAHVITIPSGDSDKSHWFEFPYTGGKVITMTNDQAMGASEEAYIEIAEILEMKPQNEDAYIVLRMASANTTDDDGDGQDTSTPKAISDKYFRQGMIYNGSTDATRTEDTYINRNPIYETIRRISHERTRFAERNSLVGYEVSGGKSILYFNRSARGLSAADIWDGIAPSENAITSGDIKHNQKYIVESGTTGITYNGASIAVGATFTGAKGIYTFTKDAGDEVVKEYDGIIETAGEKSTDNRWTFFMTQVGYQPADNSAYKPDGYGDVIGWGHDRCVTFSADWTLQSANSNAPEINRHVTPGGSIVLQRSESPSGYRYLLGTHTPPNGSGSSTLVEQQNNGDCASSDDPTDCAGIVDHYESCQIYTPDYQIESVVMDSGLVKVTLTGRLRTNSSAPASVTNSSAGWDSYLGTETGPRTDENAVVEYLRWSAGSGGNCVQRIGDWAPDVDSSTTSIIKGACMPRFYFTRQIPKVYEDSNNDPDPHDTKMISDEIVWLDLVLRAICEGYIDGQSTSDLVQVYYNSFTLKNECHEKRLFDYTYENLMLQANGNRWQRIVPASVRSDNPKMFGPMPNVSAYAQHFNQIANAINLLYRARLYLPIQIKYRNIKYYGTKPVVVSGDGNCVNGAVWAEDQSAPEATTHVSTGSWNILNSNDTIIAYQYCDIRDDGAGNCILYNDRQDVEYVLEVSELAQYALPADLYTLVVTNGGTGFNVTIDDITEKKERVYTTIGNGWTGNSTDEADYYAPDGTPQDWVDDNSSPTTCEVATSGTLQADLPDISDYIDAHDGGFAEGSDKTKNLSWYELQGFVQVPLV